MTLRRVRCTVLIFLRPTLPWLRQKCLFLNLVSCWFVAPNNNFNSYYFINNSLLVKACDLQINSKFQSFPADFTENIARHKYRAEFHF